VIEHLRGADLGRDRLDLIGAPAPSPPRKMVDVSRPRSVDTLRGYVRDAELFKDHAGAGLL
jgi:hypothetical protein